MAKIKKKKKLRKKIGLSKAKKRVRVLRVKRVKKEVVASENIFDSEVGKTDALFVDNPKTDGQLDPQADSEINEALKEFEVLQEEQVNEPAQTGAKEAIDLSNLTGADGLNTPPQRPKEENKRFSWKKLFPFFKK